LFGPAAAASAVERLVICSGGSPREILQLLQLTVTAAPDDGRITPGMLDSVIERWKAACRRTVQQTSLNWLRRVSLEKPSSLTDGRQRSFAEQILASGLLFYYRNGAAWFDVHPAIEGMLREEQLSSVAADTGSPGSSPRSPEAHTLTRLVLTNVGPFRDLSLDLRPGWNVLLGDNGCGKTSVIRAIGLALAGTDPRAAVASQRQLRAGETSGTITLTTERNKYSTSISRLPAEVRTTAGADTLTQQGRWLTLGFPAVRGLSSRAISGPTTVTPPVPGAHDLLPLLEGAADSRLDDTRQWIVNTALRVDSNESTEIRERHGRLLARWFSILRDLMPGLHFEYDRVDRDSWQVLVRTADGTIPIEQLSQGMVSTIGWIGTLLRRLYEAFPDSAEPELEPALVLVDEIDAHLHPTWQRRIVPLVRAQFPNVQVIATSHSPLIVSNLEPEELVVFRRGDEGRITAATVDEPLRGYRADQVLTSDAFGLDTSRSEYATALLQEYAEALAIGADTPEARARLAELTARVRREIPSPPETVLERRALDDATREADEAVKGQLEAASPEELERLEALVRAHRSHGDAR
jgi:energy-coupling factor transporter ATP-binding protein EcfA2